MIGEIYWCSTGAPISSDGKTVNSPAIALIHEFGHGLQYKNGVLLTDGSGNPSYETENMNIRDVENPVIKELSAVVPGKGVSFNERARGEYSQVTYYSVNSSTDYGIIISGGKGFINESPFIQKDFLRIKGVY